MSPETVARNLAANRLLIGAAFALAPERGGRAWIGSDAARGGAQLLARALGARDLALGLGTLNALRQGESARGWAQAALIADGVDLLATLAAGDSIPRGARAFALAMAGGSTAVGAWLSVRLE